MTQYGYASAHPKDVVPTALLRNGILDDDEQHNQDNSDTSTAEPAQATQTGNPENPDGYEKRYWDLKKYHDDAITKERERSRELEKQLKAKDKEAFKPPKTKEELQELRKEFPDVFDAMMSLAMEQTSSLKEEFAQEIEELKKARANEYKQLGREKILKAHPDADKVIKDQDFLDWYHSRSAGIQQLFGDNATPEDLIEGLDLYKNAKGKKSKNSNQELEQSMAVDVNSQAQVPTGKTGKVWKESDVVRLSASGQYERYEEEIDKAMAEGRFEYDISAPKR